LVQPMRAAFAVISTALIALPIPISMAQAPSGAAMPAPGTAQPAAPVVSVSAQLQPALSSVHHSVDSVHVEKWKRGNIRDEAAQNISQIQRDIDVTLPPMLRDADTAPASLSKLLPISRNMSALYDVLLRVVEASRVIGPDDQVATLQQALVTLGNARQAFNDRMQTSAVATEKQVSDLRATVQMQAAKIAATPAPVALPCTPPPPHTTTKRVVHKPAAAGAAATKAKPSPSGVKPSTPTTGTQPKPNPQQTH
jgi:hypothetical protein